MHNIKYQISNIKIANQNLKFLIFGLLFCILIFGFCIFSYAQDKIVAIVNNDIITQKDLNDFINFMRMQLATDYKGKDLEDKIQSMKLDLLDKLIEDRLILQDAKNSKINIDENRVKVRLDQIKKRYPEEAEFQKVLDRQGLTQADIELKLKEQLLMYSVIDTKIRSKIIVNPSEVTDFYQKNTPEFNAPQQRLIRLITIAGEALAKEISNTLKEGIDIDDIKDKYSLVVEEIIIQQDGRFIKDIQDLVFKMDVGETSAPVKINDKFYIIRLEQITESRQQNLTEVQDKIYAFLFDKKLQENLIKYLDELKKKSYIKILSD